MKEKMYVAQITTSRQVTEDSWKVVTPTLSISSTTSIGEIMEWAKKIDKEIHQVNIIEVCEIGE